MFLEIKGLNISLGKFRLKDVSFGLEKGNYGVIIGPTGSGKSIVLESIAGFYKPQTGQILLEGKDITSWPPEKRNISVVYQDYVLFPHMTVYENIAYGLIKRHKDKSFIQKEVEKIAKTLNISHLLDRHLTTLSGGEMQRTAIARALIIKPKLLLMDEPFSALDVQTRQELRSMVKEVVAQYQTTVLQVTHDFGDVFSLATQVIVMKEGQILQIGTAQDVFSNPTNCFIAKFVGTNIIRCKVIGKNDGLTVLSTDNLKLYSIDPATIGQQVAVAIRPENIIITPKPFVSSARNVFEATISQISQIGHIVWLKLWIKNITLKAIITPNSQELLGLKCGQKVFAFFKAANVRILDQN